MTVTMALATTASSTPARSAERGGRDDATDGRRFDEALAARPGRREPAGVRGDAANAHPAMKPVSFGSRFGQARDTPEGDDHPEAIPDMDASDAEAADIGVEAVDLAGGQPASGAEAALLALGALSAAGTSRQPASTTDAATSSGGDDGGMPADDGSRIEAGESARPAPETGPRDNHARAPDEVLPDTDGRPAPRDSGRRDDGPLRRGSHLSPREAGPGSSTPPVPPAAPGDPGQTRTQARTGDRPASASAQTAAPRSISEALWRLEASPPSEARLAGATSGSATQDGARRPALDPVGNQTGGDGRTADRANPSDALAGRVSVLGLNTALPPAPTVASLPSATVAGLVTAIEADPTWRTAAQEAGATAGQRGQGPASPVSTLRIQLNPAELGMVTARLTVTGSQLSIEIQTESGDARQRLASDSEAIVKALRAVGFDVDKVTIQQAPQSGGGQQQGAAVGRDPFAANQQAQGEGGAKERGGRGETAGQGSGHGSGEAAADRAGGDLYI